MISAVLFSLAATAAMAGDLGQIEKAHEAFNQAASRLGSDSRAVLKDCSADLARVCSVSISGNLVGMAGSSKEDHARARDFTIIAGKGSDPIAFAEAVIISMAAWSPSSDKAERGQAFKVLTSGLKNKKDTTATLGSVRYKIMPSDFTGLWLIVEPQ